MSSRKRRAEIRQKIKEIDERESWGRPGDSPGSSGGRGCASGPGLFARHTNYDMDLNRTSVLDDPSFNIPVGGAVAFIFMLCVAAALAVWTAPMFATPQQARQEQAAPVTAPASFAVKKMSGRVETVSDEMRHRTSYSTGRTLPMIPDRYVTLRNSSLHFRIPSYLKPFLWDSDLKAAQRVEIEYTDEPQRRYIRHNVYDTYYKATALKVDGTTYLTPLMFNMLDNPLSWVFIGLIVMTLGKVVWRWVME